MSEADLIAAGYREYGRAGPWSNADRFYQKAIRGGRLKLYFINVGVWDYREYDRYPMDQDPIRFAARAELYREGGRHLTLEVAAEPGDTVGTVEAEFAHAYDLLGCVSDIHNNDVEG